jgi:hypothetical protein
MQRRAHSLDHRDNVRAVGEMAEPKEALELLQPDDDGRACHEPHDGSV